MYANTLISYAYCIIQNIFIISIIILSFLKTLKQCLVKIKFYINSKEKFGFKYFIYLKIFYWYNEILNKYSTITCAFYAYQAYVMVLSSFPTMNCESWYISHFQQWLTTHTSCNRCGNVFPYSRVNVFLQIHKLKLVSKCGVPGYQNGDIRCSDCA